MHTCYSLLDSTIRIPSIVKHAKALGYQALAITDHNVMLGAAEFLAVCKAEGIKPILGMEVDCEYEEGVIVPFVLLANDNRGYQNLCRLSTLVNTSKKFCSKEELLQYSAHNTLIVYGEGGWMDRSLLNIKEDRERVRQQLLQLKQDFPSFYLALSYQDALLWKEINEILKNLAMSLRIPCVALNKIFYQEEGDYDAYQAVNVIAKHGTLDDGMIQTQRGRYFLSPQQMAALYEESELRASDEIASQCVADYHLPLASLPKYPTPNGVDSYYYLSHLCQAGLQRRCHGNIPKAYQERLAYELHVIQQMHFEDYFLIVYDYILYAKKQGIRVGPGRGSSAGSLVAYCLGITMVDPLQYNLLFERFLNPERISMPDIDTDVPDDRRNEVVSYIIEKYGKQNTGNAVVLQALGPKGAIRDVCRIMKVRSTDMEMVLRMIGSQDSLREAYQKNERLRQFVEANEKLVRMYHLAQKLEGLPRNLAQHPAGILIASQPLDNYVPLIQLQSSILSSQYEAGYLEERGLIKMDLLSLKYLATIQKICDRIQADYPDFSLSKMKLDDPMIYQVLSRGDTNGIFQCEATDMKRLLRQLKPNCFNDVVASNALIRPGASAQIQGFIANRSHPQEIVYPHPDLKEILEDTYGIMLYQEQAMKVAQVIAGFSLGRADMLRKAISKKKDEEMRQMKEAFVRGGLSNGYEPDLVNHLWESIEAFGSYGFNKSHSVAYSMLTCQMAWLKGNYPLYFYESLLDGCIGDSKKTALYIQECRRRNIKVETPDINRSGNTYVYANHCLYMPLSSIKDIGGNACKIIVDEREKNGPFVDLYDVTARLLFQKISAQAVTNLIHAGALDGFSYNRKTLLENLNNALNYADVILPRGSGAQQLDLSLASKQEMKIFKDVPHENAQNEKLVFGFTLGNDEIEMLRTKLQINDPSLIEISQSFGKEVRSFGCIDKIFEMTSKNNRKYCRLVVSDGIADIVVGIWPSDYQKLKNDLKVGTYIRFVGKMDDGGSVQARKIATVKREVSNGKNSHNG